MKSRSSELARARPLLGTLVEIRAPEDARALAAIAAAFDAIAEVDRLMSAHRPESDISRVNRLAHLRPVPVNAHTWRVLDMALAMSKATAGAFDICVAPLLARWGYLPRSLARNCEVTSGWDAIELLPDRRVRFARPLAIDVGGIAKGYAVDRAANVLRKRGIRRFTVNAGGDLRIGAAAEVLHVRDPAAPGRLIRIARLRDAAAATSAAYFAQRRRRAQHVHPIVVPGTRRCANLEGSVTVFARDCMVADALTKAVTVLGDTSAGVLARFGAQACVIGPAGRVQRYP